MAGDPYVVCDGSGDSFSTPDANLLDADTAHLHQSIGQWQSNYQMTAIQQSSALTPAFGDYHLEGASTAAGNCTLRCSAIGMGGIPVAASTEYAVSLMVASDTARTISVSVRFYDSGGSALSTPAIETTAIVTPNTWVAVAGSLISHVSAAYATVMVTLDSAAGAGEKLYIDQVLVAEGSDTTFIPSIRLVGNVDQRAKLAFDASPASTQYIGGIWGGSASRQAFRLIGVSGGQVRADVKVAGPVQNSVAATATTPTSATVWRHTFDVSSGAHVLYEDGAAVDSDTDTTGAVEVVTDHGVLEVGAGGSNTPGSANLFDGTILYYELRDGIDGPIVRRMDPGDIYG